MILVILSVLLGQPATAAGNDIRVVTESWIPYTCTEDGKVWGMATEIVEATLQQAGLGYSIEVYPWARAYDMAINNENVLIYSIIRLPRRERSFKWIQMNGLHTDMYLFRPRHRVDVTASTLNEAKDYRIGVTRETSTHHFLLSMGFVEGINLFPVNCEEQNYRKSFPQTGRIDMTTGDRQLMAQRLKAANQPTDYWVPQVPLFRENLYMAFGIHTQDEMVDRVRTAFQEICESGKFAAILAKHEYEPTQPENPHQ